MEKIINEKFELYNDVIITKYTSSYLNYCSYRCVLMSNCFINRKFIGKCFSNTRRDSTTIYFRYLNYIK